MTPRLLPVGDAAISVELGDGIDPALAARVRGLDHAVRRRPLAGVVETVPTYRSLLVVFDPTATTATDVRQGLQERLDAAAEQAPPGALHVIPTRYGGDEGEDLEAVARACHLTPAEVVAAHTARDYTAFMLGFTPGFAYLGPVTPPLSAVPRRDTPRARIAAGSVAVAAGQTAIYPIASPGGWHLLGRTSARLFDPQADPPALIAPGDRVRFTAVEVLPKAPALAAPRPPRDGPVEVLDAGLLTTVQDLGRRGYRRLGVGSAGAMDPAALAAANALLGNTPDAAGLEVTGPGLALRFLAAVHFAVTGGDLGAHLERPDLGDWPVPIGQAVLARRGNLLRFAARRSGFRAWVAFGGGLDLEPVLGSRSTDLGGHFGGYLGRALGSGDRLSLRPERGGPRLERWVSPAPQEVVTLRVVLGPQDDHFTPEALTTFLASEYAVEARSDRVGCRLMGPPLAHAGGAEIVSDGMLPGCVQVPPSGQPIVVGPDAPTTGGYPKIATVVTADLGLLGQVVPGEGRLRFAVLKP